MTGCYLIHFDRPYVSPNGRKTIQHYLGWASDVDLRLIRHRSGLGARVMEVVTDAGVPWQLARVWENATRTDERMLKNQHCHKCYCPLCRVTPSARKRGKRI